MGFRVQGLEFTIGCVVVVVERHVFHLNALRVQENLGLMFEGSGVEAWRLGFGVLKYGFGIYEFRVYGLG